MTLSDFWNQTIFRVGQDSVTAGSIVLTLALLIVGFFLARLLSRLTSRMLVRRFGVDPNARVAIETLSFYLLYIAIAFTSLNLVKFPLTIFTIAGGALAIGVGFGSQNLMNNFISGLILHLERPMRVGDLIAV